MNARTRILLFIAIVIAALAGAAGYVRFAALRPIAPQAAPGDPVVQWIDGDSPAAPYLLFRSTLPGRSFGRVGYVPIDRLDGPRYLTPIACDRLYFRAGHGVCLTIEDDRRFPARAALFDARFQPGASFRLTGPPSRTRVSPDGALAAVTVFETGHSYAEAGFSTRTSLIDTGAGRIITDLEQFDVRRDGVPFKPVDANFWGVTFLEHRDFYATLLTGGQIHLIRGNVDTRRATVLHDGVECPSLSPDGSRIAFKKRIAGRLGVAWQVAVLDLATSRETVLDQEHRSVDDQVEWLDAGEVIYHLSSSHGADIWALRIDNREPPRLLLSGAYSPAVVRD